MFCIYVSTVELQKTKHSGPGKKFGFLGRSVAVHVAARLGSSTGKVLVETGLIVNVQLYVSLEYCMKFICYSINLTRLFQIEKKH